MRLLDQEAHNLRLDKVKSFHIRDLYFDIGFNTVVRTSRDSVKPTAQVTLASLEKEMAHSR